MAIAMLQMGGYYRVVPTRKQYVSNSNLSRRSCNATVVRISNVASSGQGPLSSYWASVNLEIEDYIKRAIPAREPRAVFEPMRHLALHAPPSHAPALCVAACEAVGGSADRAMAAAAAVSLMHAAASAHDDLLSTRRPNGSPGQRDFGPAHDDLDLLSACRPNMSAGQRDFDPARRPNGPVGQRDFDPACGPSGPTGQRDIEPNIKLMTGDGIVPFGFELLSRPGPGQNDPARVLRVMVEIARAVGSEGVVEGQYEEVLGRVDRAWGKKEGELHACAGACGAILGGGSEDEVETLRRFGRCVGTIQGMVNWGKNGEIVEEMKKLALSELKGLSEKNIEALAKLVELDLCNV